MAEQSLLYADGVVFKKGGQYIPETQQRAYITWRDGLERLWLTTHTGPAEGPSVWILPVPGSPDDIQAQPVEQIPNVSRFREIVGAARQSLHESRELAVLFDTGLFPFCPFVGDKKTASRSMTPEGMVTEHQRIEKLGMVVTVVTAKTNAGLDGYLRANEVNATAAQLTSFTPYFNQDYALICGWVAQPGAKAEARGICVDFPTPEVYYPLRPSRVYRSKIETAIYVQGQWRLPEGTSAGGMKCKYVFGTVEKGGPASDDWEGVRHNVTLTRIQIEGLPSEWSQDIRLRPGAPAQIPVARSLVFYPWGFWTRVGLGLLLAMWMPLAAIPRAQRSMWDWAWAGGVGASIAASVYLSLVVFALWCSRRKLIDETSSSFRGRFWKGVAVVGPCLIGLLIVAAVVATGRRSDLLVLIATCGLPYVFLVSMASAGFAVAGWRVLFLIAFAGAHLAASVGLLELMDNWLRQVT